MNAIELRKEVDKKCHDFFRKIGYDEHKEEPVIPSTDKTVLFTNSAIIPFKQYIDSNNFPERPTFLRQKCIRLRESKKIPDENYQMKRMSCFHMYGSFAKIEHLKKICEDLISLLRVLGVGEKLRFDVSSKDEIFYKHIVELDLIDRIFEDIEDISQYRWGYGMNHVSGRGINIGIVPENPNLPSGIDDIGIGQIIVIEKNGVPYCVETCIGIETFVARRLELDSVFRCSEIAESIAFDNQPLRIQLMDSIVVAIELYSNGVRLQNISRDDRKEGRTRESCLKKAIKCIAEIQHLLDYEDSVVNQHILSYTSSKGVSDRIANEVIYHKEKAKEGYKKKIVNFENYARICINRVERNEIDTAKAKELIDDRGRKDSLYKSDIKRSRSPI